MSAHYPTTVCMADVADPTDLLAAVAAWPPLWRDHFAERDAILNVEAKIPHVPAIREAFKDTVRAAARSDEHLAMPTAPQAAFRS